MKNLLNSFKYAVTGIKTALSREAHLRVHVVVGVIVVVTSFYLRLSILELLLVFNAVFLVIIAEMFNTALEVLTDYASKGRKNEKAGMAKDIAAGAVLLAALFSVIVAAFIIFPRFG